MKTVVAVISWKWKISPLDDTKFTFWPRNILSQATQNQCILLLKLSSILTIPLITIIFHCFSVPLATRRIGDLNFFILTLDAKWKFFLFFSRKNSNSFIFNLIANHNKKSKIKKKKLKFHNLWNLENKLREENKFKKRKINFLPFFI